MPKSHGGKGKAFKALCRTAAKAVGKHVQDSGAREIKRTIKSAGIDLDKAVRRQDLHPLLKGLLCQLFQPADVPKEIAAVAAAKIIQRHETVLTAVVNTLRDRQVELALPAPRAAAPTPAPAPTQESRARSLLAPLSANTPAHASPPPSTPIVSRASRPPTIQPKMVGERVGAMGQPRLVLTVPGANSPFASNPLAGFTLPVILDGGQLFSFQRIVACIQDDSDRWYVEIEWEPSLVPLIDVPVEALGHAPSRRVAVRAAEPVAVGGQARFAVHGVLEIVATPQQEYALVQWANTIEPVGNVTREALDAFWETFNSSAL